MKRTLYLLLILIVISGSTVFAAPDGTRADKLETLKIWKLIDFLQLSDQQADKFLPRFRNFEKDIRGLQRDKNKQILELGKKIKAGRTKGVDKDVNSVLEYDIKIAQRKKDFFKSVKGIISEEQMAKMIIFEAQFRREIRRMIENRANMKNSFRRR